jgi:RecB family exonuclease
MSGEDYARLLDGVLAAGSVRRPDTGHPRILIWGTLEARVQGAELLVLGGLNEGTWPEAPAPDPWLNRAMRDAAGLLLPERRIGLSAHDFQQAVCGAEVWLTRATRDDSAETVPSRWLNRLTNLMGGLGETGGREVLEGMRGRGRRWLAWAEELARPEAAVPAARRPSPRLAGRLPERLSVTQVSRLIRDPYAVYAQSILRLRETGALMPEPGAPERGSALHRVLEVAVEAGAAQDPARLVEVAERVLEEEVPWPTARRFWLARLARVAPWFARTEAERALRGTPAHFELFGRLRHESLPVEFRGKADRIDLAPDGRVLIYDYKTGEPPNAKQQQHFDKQLLVTAAMMERGAFEALGARAVAEASFIGLAKNPKEVSAPFDAAPPDAEWAGLTELLEGYHAGRHGYTARRAPFADAETSPADHLARYGEWEPADEPHPEDIP